MALQGGYVSNGEGDGDSTNTTVSFLAFQRKHLNKNNADEALQNLNGTAIGKQTVRLSWGRNPANKQQLLFRVLGCQPQGAAVHNFVIQLALSMVASESIKIYNAITDGTVNLVDKFFEMNRQDALRALEIYKRPDLNFQLFVDSVLCLCCQIELISRLHHFHVVPLLGFCSENQGKRVERLLFRAEYGNQWTGAYYGGQLYDGYGYAMPAHDPRLYADAAYGASYPVYDTHQQFTIRKRRMIHPCGIAPVVLANFSLKPEWNPSENLCNLLVTHAIRFTGIPDYNRELY
ncbi:hypothetical protein POM88_017566 [Heracleum sosnowskyi]|uniref:AP180 N-terminal homology (ANTH) domain-containing protein n=1 Tax=Heracleum sosnowskyi TaxID=360622 RepID=A0AAD8MZH4_9APIA|nr:hypothetical protein POM88_017566 [Heracleum sosnowskyi]